MPSRLVAFIARLCGLLALGLWPVGCIWNLPKDLVVLSAMDSCPDYGLMDLPEHAKIFDHTTSSDELRCALYKLRTAAIPFEVHWTGTPARICYLLADRTSNPDDRDRLAAEGVRWAEIAYEHGSPEPGRVQYYLSINLGLAARDPPALAMKNVRVLEKALLEAIKLAPEEEQGGPLRLLGTLYLLAPPWPDGIGDSDKAMKYLRRAVQEYPDHPLNLIFLALALVDTEEEAGSADATMLLKRAKVLIEQGPYGDARARWMKELKNVVEKGELHLD
jgi:hypothetical protein